MKFATRNCTSREAAAAHEQRRPNADARRASPAITHTSQTGTISEKNGSCRPAIALSVDRIETPVTCASVRIGVPSAPNATGDVFASSASPAAYSGRKPAPSSSAAEMATGVPKPAAPSTKRRSRTR